MIEEKTTEELDEDIIEDGDTTTEEDLEKLALYKNRFDSVMNYSNPYYQFISSIMQKTLVMRMSQLMIFIQKKFNISELKANELVLEAQRLNYIIVTKDDYVMTNGFYLSKNDDQFFDALCYNNYLTHYEKNLKPMLTADELHYIDCYTVVAKMMPFSENFFIPSSPWTIAFVTPASLIKENAIGNLYEIIYIPENNSTALCYALNEKYREKREETQPFIKRIAIVENENDVAKVPYIGFTNIVKVNGDKLKFLQERKENAWG